MSNRCLNFTVTEKLFFKNLPGTRGAPSLGGPLDFAHPIATPLVLMGIFVKSSVVSNSAIGCLQPIALLLTTGVAWWLNGRAPDS